MKIFVDDSGGFGWCPPGVSLFCALSVSDRTLDALISRFVRWKGLQPNGSDSREIKGKNLAQWQQSSFATSVILADPYARLILAGTDTNLFQRELAQRFTKDSAATLRACAKWAMESEKPLLVEFYNSMARWMDDRSPENVLWVGSLVHAIRLALQVSIVQFAEEEHDSEFENVEILIDRSFISKQKHDTYWREWLRSALLLESKKEPTLTIKEWSTRDHPFVRKYRKRPGILDWMDLFRNNMRFVDSRDVVGIQIADICANIAFRHYSGNRKYRPYRLLRARASGRDSVEMNLRVMNESSLVTDAPGNHIHPYSEDDLIAWAEARQAS